MKITAIFILMICLRVSAGTYGQTVSYAGNNITLQTFFTTIKKQTGYTVFCNSSILKRAERVSVNAENASLEEVLAKVLHKQGLVFTIEEKMIVVSRGSAPDHEDKVIPPPVNIRGKVTDENGYGLPGVSILVKGTQRGTTSNADGTFKLDVESENTRLIFSFVGYQSQEVLIGRKTDLSISMKTDDKSFDEVVVVGYGTTRKKDLTGSVISIKSDELVKSNPVTLEQGIQGKAAGVFVTQTDGAPGAGMSIQIRGASSFMGGTEPLYVVDGVPLVDDNASATPKSGSSFDQQKTNMLSFLNTSDIESIEILKDASSTAIYGSRGANGVVLITTKKGGKGKDRIELNLVTSLSQISKKYDMLDAEQFATYQNEAYLNSDTYLGTTYGKDKTIPYPGRFDLVQNSYLKAPADFRGRSTDWQDAIYRTALKQDYTLNFSGGSGGNTYLIGGNLIDQNGIISNSKFKRYSLRVNINRQVKNWLQAGATLNYSNTINKMVSTGASIVGPEGGVVKSAMTFHPTIPMRDTLTDQFSQLYITSNPYQYVKQSLNQVTGSRLTSSAFADVTFMPGFRFRSIFGWNTSFDRRDQYFPQSINEGATAKGRAYVSDNNSQNVSSESYFTYDHKWGQHAVNATAGMSYGSGVWQYKYIGVSGFMNDALQNNNLGAGTIVDPPSSAKSEWSLLSYYGRLNYIFDDRYLATITYRRDGSSKFAKNNKWAGFLSGAFAWRFSQEQFLKNSPWLSNGKLRLSYGQSGNQGIGSYGSLSHISAANYPYGGVLTNGYLVTSLGNDNLKWETTAQVDGGLDLGFFKDRLSFVFDYYYKRTHDLLQNVTLPSSTGYTTQVRNIGEIENRGFEATVNARLVDRKDFTIGVSGNISFNKNKILDLGDVTEQWAAQIGTEPINYKPFVQRVGQPIGIVVGYQEDGIFQNEEEVAASGFFKGQPAAVIKRMPGEIRYKDLNGDQVIDDKDRTVIGNVNPDFYYGFSTNVTYKRFDMSVFFQGVQGGQIINTLRYVTDNLGDFSNTTQQAYDNRWTGPGSTGVNPKAILNSFRDLKFSDRFVENGSYLRIKNINMGYNFNFKSKKIVQAIRLYTSINNVLTFTKYSGYDPEVNAYGQDPSRRGIDLGNYPNSRTFSLGVNCTF
ncbi:SusC/RagA family TonB-linked outer membrane protein [Dyadobacter frigoris]|nr:SusC/RagA family TonB-linked outer membrane protein [Dyadobacter frigoris]